MKLFAIGAAVAGTLLFASAASAATFYSEDFSGYSPLTIAHGATGQNAATSTSGHTISTDYSYRVPNGQNHGNQPDSMYDEGTWTIGTNPFDVHDLWVNQPGSDPFLMLNGATANSNPPKTAWESEGISVAAGRYNYSYDLLNLCCNANGPAGTPSFLQLWYFAPGNPNPININSVVHTTSASNGWDHVDGVFTIGQPGGIIRLGLSDNTTIASGNDFGVDNINLASAPEPAAWALMIGGFGLAGAALRRRKAATA